MVVGEVRKETRYKTVDGEQVPYEIDVKDHRIQIGEKMLVTAPPNENIGEELPPLPLFAELAEAFDALKAPEPIAVRMIPVLRMQPAEARVIVTGFGEYCRRRQAGGGR